MSLEVSLFRPQGHERMPKSVIVAPFGHRGNPVNGGDLRQATADATDSLVIGLQLPSTSRIIIDRVTRRGLTSAEFPAFAAAHARDLSAIIGGFRHRGIWADSGAGLWGAEMWAQEPELFNWGLFRDGVNLHAPHTLLAGAVRQKRFSKHPRLRPADQLDAPRRYPYSRAATELIGAAEMWHQRRLLTGSSSRDAFLALAATPEAGFTYVQPSDALGGTDGMHRRFFEDMRAERTKAAASHAGRIAIVDTHVQSDMSHSDLLAPNLLLDHLQLAAHNATHQQ